jgi:hypothetical protein
VTDLTALLRRILDDRDLAACGVLADYLEERGDARGVLLRRRWKRWGRERMEGEQKDEAYRTEVAASVNAAFAAVLRMGGTAEITVSTGYAKEADISLCRYIRGRFPEWNREQVRRFGESMACAARHH